MILGIKCCECTEEVSTRDFVWYVTAYITKKIILPAVSAYVTQMAARYLIPTRGIIDDAIHTLESGMAVCANEMEFACPKCKKSHWKLNESNESIDSNVEVLASSESKPEMGVL